MAATSSRVWPRESMAASSVSPFLSVSGEKTTECSLTKRLKMLASMRSSHHSSLSTRLLVNGTSSADSFVSCSASPVASPGGGGAGGSKGICVSSGDSETEEQGALEDSEVVGSVVPSSAQTPLRTEVMGEQRSSTAARRVQ